MLGYKYLWVYDICGTLYMDLYNNQMIKVKGFL